MNRSARPVARRFRTQRAGLLRWVLLTLALGAGCEAKVSLTLQLVKPCGADGLFDPSCQYVQVIVSSLDPKDPLYCLPSNGQRPEMAECALIDGGCQVEGGSLVGRLKRLDVFCVAEQSGSNPLSRASSQLLDLRDPLDDKDASLGLLMGPIKGFLPTTVVSPWQLDVGQCSVLAQDGGRYGHASVQLQDGRVLLTGGLLRTPEGSEVSLPTAEVYDPRTGSHHLVTGKDGVPVTMLESGGRAFHSALRLRDGRVLLAGGIQLRDGVKTSLGTAELFDPASEVFESLSQMDGERVHFTLTELPDEKILLIGGASYVNGQPGPYHDTAVVYSPKDNEWEGVSGSMSAARAFHQSVRIGAPGTSGDRVMISGGENGSGPTDRLEFFDVTTRKFLPEVTLKMAKKRSRHCAVPLLDGDVAILGGSTSGTSSGVDKGVELYSPTASGNPAGGFRVHSLQLSVARMDHTCTLLENGQVLVAGGQTADASAVGSSELLASRPEGRTLQPLPTPMKPGRIFHTAIRLDSGWIYFSGGLENASSPGPALSTATLFVPPPVGCP